MKRYERIDIQVEGIFGRDGSVRPEAVIFEDKRYPITRIKSCNLRWSAGVPCIAPVEYRVVIDGVEKSIYYERETNKWFSVKESTV